MLYRNRSILKFIYRRSGYSKKQKTELKGRKMYPENQLSQIRIHKGAESRPEKPENRAERQKRHPVSSH